MPKGQYDREEARLKREDRNRALADELSDEPISLDAPEPAPAAPPEPSAPVVVAEVSAPVPPPVSVPLDALAQLIASISATLGESQTKALGAILEQQNASLSAMLTTQAQTTAKIARDRIHENMTSPDVSVFNPYGERDHPMPELQGKVYVAQLHPDTRQVERLHEWEGGRNGGLTYDEIVLVNALDNEPLTPITMADDSQWTMEVRVERAPGGKADRKLILIPFGFLGKKMFYDTRHAMIGPGRIARQFLGETRAAAALAAAQAARDREDAARTVAA